VCFQFVKDQLGLGDYEARSWTGWHRHTVLVLAVQAFLGVLHSQVEPLGLPFFCNSPLGWLSGCVQSGPWTLVRLSLAELRRWLWRLVFPRSWSLEFVKH